MSRDKKGWVYVWGVGWFDPNDTGVLPFSLKGIFSNGCAIVIVVMLALLGVAVIEWVFPGLPWLM